MKKILSGNQALAYGALAAGVDVVAGYPGTPSTEALTEILAFAGKHESAPWVEWSTNEKVAFDVATGAAWAGKRALATMKMSGLNVALDSVMSVAYSGTTGGFVLYVSDDPGAEAGMPEQDSRLFSLLAGLPMLEPGTPGEAYALTKDAFDLSERTGTPVIVRLVTSVAHGEAEVEADFRYLPSDRKAGHERDITKFTKAGSKICVDQHKALIERLETCEDIYGGSGWNRTHPAKSPQVAVVSSGVLNEYMDEVLADYPNLSSVRMTATYPLDRKTFRKVMKTHDRMLVLEELDPVLEMQIRSLAHLEGWNGKVVGKMDGTLPKTGRYSLEEIRTGIAAVLGEVPDDGKRPETPQYRHTITFCSGCPHRGTYMALNRGIKKAGFRKKDIMVTGDIGCTILGMNPPFDSCWTEVSMGSSIGLAQGFFRAGMETPVVATIGDSTFFHAGLPPLINAVQQNADILLIILDNGWTSMTGFQVNPGTQAALQPGNRRRVDMDAVIHAIGVDYFAVIRPFDQDAAVEVISEALVMKGVRVLVSREECALTRERRESLGDTYVIDPETCVFCKACLRESGCTALSPGKDGEKDVMTIDPDLCRSCGLCETCCKFGAISKGGCVMLKSVLCTGVGGQGVVTMANLITTHLESRGLKVTLIHATGMAQRGGRVTSEIRFSDDPAAGFGPRISTGGADFMIGLDMAETINSFSFMKSGGVLLFHEYTLVPSRAVLKKERFPDGSEVRELFSDRCGRVVTLSDPVRPVNMFSLGVFSSICEADGDLSGILNPGSMKKTLETSLTRRMEENLAAFDRGTEFGGQA